MTLGSETLDALVERIMQRAEGLDEGYRRVGLLVSAAQAVTESLELTTRLQRIVGVARELVGARYGALGVLAPDGGLERFLHSGFTDEQVRQLGAPPSGRGILGAVITEGRSIRMEHLSHDPRSVGFPPHHPPMDSFLGVPIHVEGTVFGNLYLTEHREGPFDDIDEAIIAALAAMAGTAIANSRLYEQSQDDRRWLAASERLTQRLLSGEVEPDDLEAITTSVRELTGAPYVVVVDAAGDDGAAGAALALAQLADPGQLGPVLVVPLEGGTGERAVAGLGIARGPHGHPFTDADRETVARFARSVAIARELARARIDEQWVALTDERDRIARDLHDHVIQSLFAVGLSLQSVVGDPSTPTGARIATQVDAIDSTIRQIRQAIYRLSAPPSAGTYSLRARINTLVRETLDGESLDSRLEFSGPVDTLVDLGLGDEVCAVMREAISNVVRHASATLVEASVAVRGAQVVVLVRDDGVGMPETDRRSGLANLAARARERGGDFTIEAVQPHGTAVRWSVPWESR
ncbi:GAF domain-containing protein [Microcella sp.]|uniref:GAF domain-containing sensor histidine kinase n=1 Tax=Microcella sp. TaxID=1913979 RepID=UPI003F71120B